MNMGDEFCLGPPKAGIHQCSFGDSRNGSKLPGFPRRKKRPLLGEHRSRWCAAKAAATRQNSNIAVG